MIGNLFQRSLSVEQILRTYSPDPSMKNFMYANLTYREISKYIGSYSDRVVDESNQDLEDLSDELKKLGVKVYRPKQIKHDHLLLRHIGKRLVGIIIVLVTFF